MVIDYIMQKTMAQPFDKNGATAETGQVNRPILAQLMQDEYVLRPPPKTTGREYFGKDFSENLYSMCKASNLPDSDIIAIATAFTAETICHSAKNFILYPIQKLIISGGGAYNRTLIKMISHALPNVIVMTQDETGRNSDSKEAVAFAILANETVSGNAGNLPNVTGAQQRKVLGKINLV